jgi:hypothetical protein
MKKTAILLIFLLFTLISCTGKKAQNNSEVVTDIDTNHSYSGNNVNNDIFYIGGLPVSYSEIDGITDFRLDIYPMNEKSDNSLEGIELLVNITNLTIRGQGSTDFGEEDSWHDINGIDFSPLKSLKKLKEIKIAYLILNEIPDLSGIPSLESVNILRCKILSLNGIEKANQIKKLKFTFFKGFSDDFSVLSALTKLEELTFYYEYGGEEMENYTFHVSDLSGITGLKHLFLGHFSNVDFNGTKNLSRLEYLGLSRDVNIINIQELAWLTNLQTISKLTIPAHVTSLSFLTPLTNLTDLFLYGNENTIDIELIKNMKKLNQLMLANFTIINFQILDTLPELDNVMTYSSKFIPENNNKLKHAMVSYEMEGP